MDGPKPRVGRRDKTARGFVDALSPSARAFLQEQGLELEHAPPAPRVTAPAARTALLELEAVRRPRKPQPHRRGKYQRALEREGRAEARWKRRHAARMAAQGVDLKHAPPAFRRHTFVSVRAMLSDGSSQLLRKKLRHLRALAPAYVTAVIKAALGPGDAGCRRSWHSPRARAIAVLGWALWMEATRARRKGRYRRIVKGFVQSSLSALLEDPYSERRPARTTLAGRSFVGASLELGGLGYLRALEAAGALYCQQLPVDSVDPCERFIVTKRDAQGREYTEERSANRMWLNCGDVHDAHLDDAERETLQRLASVAELVLSTARLVIAKRTRRAAPAALEPPSTG